jgi:hypothetical protein
VNDDLGRVIRVVADALGEMSATLRDLVDDLSDPPPPASTPLPPPPPPPASPATPSDILDLTRWTIMRPTGVQGHPDNGYLPQGQSIPGVVFADRGAVVLRTVADGVHSPGSRYPRTELRQMDDADGTKSGWSSGDEHVMRVELAADTTHLHARPRIVVAQIHDGDDDVVQVVVSESGVVGVSSDDGDRWVPLIPDYRGTWLDVQIRVVDNAIHVSVSNTFTVIRKSGTGWYFKAGCYLQTGGSSAWREPDGAYGEVRIRSIRVS